MMQRRGFLGAMFAAMAAPAIVRSSSIMRISPPALVLPHRFALDRALGLAGLAPIEGGYLIEGAAIGFIEMLRNKSVGLQKMGACRFPRMIPPVSIITDLDQ